MRLGGAVVVAFLIVAAVYVYAQTLA